MTKLTEEAAKLLCMHPGDPKKDDPHSLSARELQSLHIMKHEILVAIHKLYEKIDPEKAEPIIRQKILSLFESVPPEE